jgi:hypothetical protein
VSYGLVVNRLAIILALLAEEPATNSPPTAADPDASSGGRPPSRRAELERCFLSFPLLCMGGFIDMIRAGDSRALLVLYHMYNAARILIGVGGPWWAADRSTVMAGRIGQELRERGQGRFLDLDLVLSGEAAFEMESTNDGASGNDGPVLRCDYDVIGHLAMHES